jgi:endo-1,4-beta-xylanase
MKLNKLSWFVVFSFIAAILFNSCSQTNTNNEEVTEPTLKDAYKNAFLIGGALNTDQIFGEDSTSIQVVKKHFNSIVAENCMKSMYLQPQNGQFFFDEADAFVKFGEENDMFIIGHTLIWHSQAPRWFFVDENGNDVSRDTLVARMKNHIQTIVGRYKGRVNGWDVVNEAILDDGSFRKNKFYEIVGEDYIKLAFEFAHEADPDAELYYNDYNMPKEGKRQTVVEIVKSFQEQGVKIDGIGMQGHSGLSYPNMAEFEKSVIAYGALGVNVMITELDVSVLPLPGSNIGAEVSASFEYQEKMNPYKEGLPDSVYNVFESKYIEFFNLFLKHQEVISRVTFWGVNDAQNWKNNWPIDGRTDYTMLFDRNNEPKPVLNKVIELANNN